MVNAGEKSTCAFDKRRMEGHPEIFQSTYGTDQLTRTYSSMVLQCPKGVQLLPEIPSYPKESRKGLEYACGVQSRAVVLNFPIAATR